MKVSICTQDYSPTGDMLLTAQESSDFKFLSRRMTRTATLDGGAYFVDNGHTPSDGTITIKILPIDNSPTVYAAIANMLKNFGFYTVSAPDGLFLAGFESMSNSETELTLNFLIKSQLA